jgi:tetratricopeptide (TPR) repeat protein
VPELTPAPGLDLGRFVLVERVGVGERSEVWRAWEKEPKRFVALKFVAGPAPDKLPKIAHPNIAEIYGAESRDGKTFFSTQLLRGGSLEHSPPKLRAALEAVRDAARALEHAHAKGLVHGNVKPSNVILEAGRVVLTDFGLARPPSAYTAPGPAGPRADIYSLGATLYRLAVGRPPFESAPTPLQSVPAPRRINPDIAWDLETIILKSMDRDPARRYAAAEELAEEIQCFLDGRPIRATRPSFTYRMIQHVSRHRKVAAAVAALVIGLLLAAVFLSSSPRGDQEALLRLSSLFNAVLLAKQGFHQAGKDPDSTRADILAALRPFESIHLPQARYLEARGCVFLDRLELAEKHLRSAIRLQPDFEPAWALLARIKLDLHFRCTLAAPVSPRLAHRDARPLMAEAREALSRVRGGSFAPWGLVMTPDELEAESLARVLLSIVRGRHAEARAALSRGSSAEQLYWLALAGDESDRIPTLSRALAISPHHPAALTVRGSMRVQLGDVDGGLDDLSRALRASPEMYAARLHRGSALDRSSRIDEAREDYRAAARANATAVLPRLALGNLEIQTGNYRAAIEEFTAVLSRDPECVAALEGRGAAKLKLGDPQGAIVDLDRSLELDLGSIPARVNRAAARLRAGDLAGAEQDTDRALGQDPDCAAALAQRGRLRARRKDLEAAMEDLSRAIEIDPRCDAAWLARAAIQSAPEPKVRDYTRYLELAPNDSEARLERTRARIEAGDLAGAFKDCDEIMARHPGFSAVWAVRGRIRMKQGEPAAAISDLDRALRENPQDVEALRWRGAALLKTGKAAAAEKDLTRALELQPDAPSALRDRAAARRGLGDRAGAVEDLTRWIALEPGSAEAYAERALVAEEMAERSPAEAVTLLKRAEADAARAVELAGPGDGRGALLSRIRERLK